MRNATERGVRAGRAPGAPTAFNNPIHLFSKRCFFQNTGQIILVHGEGSQDVCSKRRGVVCFILTPPTPHNFSNDLL